jgi:type IV fimbrial biogenesis protein FimT
MAPHARGFTLVELLVGITLLAVLLGLGAPAMSTYLQNSKLASAAASYFNGLQVARTEAIRRNVRTEFVLTDTPVSTADLANALTPVATGKNWVVRAASGAAAGTFEAAIDAKDGAEGSGGPGTAIQVSTSASGVIAFNGFGATADQAPYSIEITNPAAGACVEMGGPIRCRRINISPGGQIHACDPAASAVIGDNRAC